MDARAFFYLVKQMRQAQREYFAQRDTWTLRRARALEGDVDREILRVMDIVNAHERAEQDALLVTMVPPSAEHGT